AERHRQTLAEDTDDVEPVDQDWVRPQQDRPGHSHEEDARLDQREEVRHASASTPGRRCSHPSVHRSAPSLLVACRILPPPSSTSASTMTGVESWGGTSTWTGLAPMAA